ncbi:hypothetical protein FOA52_000712 [Chlamydomonas sp. UWO 241]|nr:hypothetical protein FOA52_000712 [Chlamydomonas sp. UWO 241]
MPPKAKQLRRAQGEKTEPAGLPEPVEPAGPPAPLGVPAVHAELPQSLAALITSLPPGLLAQVFSSLRACDVAAAAAVCSAWRAVVDQEAVAWMRAMAELDPFCSLEGSDGAFKLFHAAGDSWLRVAAALAGCVESCAACPPGSSAKATGEVLCRCTANALEQKVAACTAAAGGSLPSDDAHDEGDEGAGEPDNLGPIVTGTPPRPISTGGFVKRCTAHCAHSEGCVQLNGRLVNRWLLDARRPDAVYAYDDSDDEDNDDDRDRILVGDGTRASGARLQAELQNPIIYIPSTTVRISGTFLFDNAEHLMITGRHVRIVGDGTAVIRTGDPIFPMAKLTVLENLRVEVQQTSVCGCPGYCTLCSNGLDCNPAVQVKDGCHLIAQDLTLKRANSDGEDCVGVDALSRSKLAMYDCTVKDANWGVATGCDASVLSRHNTFNNVHEGRFRPPEEKIRGRKEVVGQVVQPWREGWVVPPAPGRAEVP